MKEAIKHYEAALKEAFPRGATGDVFHHWNEARKILEQPAQQEPVAWRWSESDGKHWFDWHSDWTHHDRAKAMGFPIEYAYTRPQAREPLTDRDNAIIRFAVHRFMSDAYARMNAAAQDKDSRHFSPGAVDAFAKDAKDAEALLARLPAAHGIGEKK